MFDAARAALLASEAPVEPEIARTHGGLVSAFSLHLVKTGRVSVELGKALNKAEELRFFAAKGRWLTIPLHGCRQVDVAAPGAYRVHHRSQPSPSRQRRLLRVLHSLFPRMPESRIGHPDRGGLSSTSIDRNGDSSCLLHRLRCLPNFRVA